MGAALGALTAAVRSLPVGVSYGLADVAAAIVAAYTVAHDRRVARKGRGLRRNLRIAFRESLTPARERELLWAWSRHMARLVVDFCRLPAIDADRLAEAVDAAAVDELRPIHAEGNGLLCVSGHIGVWELLGHVPSVQGDPVTVVVRPMHPKPVNDVVNGIRRSGGQIVLEKKGALLPLKKALERGEPVGFLADENTSEEPVFAPFLGTLAATSPAAAFLQRVTGAPIAVVSCNRTGRGRFRYHVWEVIRAEVGDDEQADLERVTTAINRALTRAVLAYPEQWLWGSRRFLTRPPGEKPGPDGLPPLAQEPA
jgi:KDO2-lipid IV(A) lauroyltransferase